MKKIVSTFLVYAFISILSIAFAQKGFMKIGDIDGEATDRGHENWIIIESVMQGISSGNLPTGIRALAGKSNFEPVVISKSIDKSSPLLMTGCASGKHYADATIELTRPDGSVHYIIKLSDIVITSVKSQAQCISGCEVMEEVKFNFSKISWEYKDSKGKVTKGGWDIKTNKAL